MADIFFYAYVEDEPSGNVAIKLFEECNETREQKLQFAEGFPAITHGNSRIRDKCPAFLNMAQGGLNTFVITDLDTTVCAGELIRKWFSIPDDDPVLLPDEILFRIAVREIESWILADRQAWSEHIGIPVANFARSPDQLNDPKQHLLNVIRNKGRKKIHREMLPIQSAHIGPRYNDVLNEFIIDSWNPSRAADRSPSLKRAIQALDDF